MRPFSIMFLLLATVALPLAAETPSTSAPATHPARPVDLKANPLVQKAMADQDKASQEADADYAKKLEALKAEHQKKIDLAKSACVAALHRAEAVADARNNHDEALTIKALAESIQSEITPDPKPAPKPNAKAFVGRWVVANGKAFVLNADGAVHNEWDSNTGKWTLDKTGTIIDIKWQQGGFTERFTQSADKKWSRAGSKNGGPFGAEEPITPPAPPQ